MDTLQTWGPSPNPVEVTSVGARGQRQNSAAANSGGRMVTNELISPRLPLPQPHQASFLPEVALVLGKSWGYFGFI